MKSFLILALLSFTSLSFGQAEINGTYHYRAALPQVSKLSSTELALKMSSLISSHKEKGFKWRFFCLNRIVKIQIEQRSDELVLNGSMSCINRNSTVISAQEIGKYLEEELSKELGMRIAPRGMPRPSAGGGN